MTAPTVGDRRRHARVRSRLPVRLSSQDGREGTALARDMSAGGLGMEIRFNRHGQCGDLTNWQGRIDIEVDLPLGHTVRIAAEMMWWHRDIGEEVGRYRGGLRFLDVEPSDSARLEDLVISMAEEGSWRCGPGQGQSFRGPRWQG